MWNIACIRITSLVPNVLMLLYIICSMMLGSGYVFLCVVLLVVCVGLSNRSVIFVCVLDSIVSFVIFALLLLVLIIVEGWDQYLVHCY